MSHFSRADLRGIGLSAIGSAVGLICGVCLTLVLALGMSTDDFATYSVGVAVSQAISVLMGFGADRTGLVLIGNSKVSDRPEIVRSMVALLLPASILAVPIAGGAFWLFARNAVGSPGTSLVVWCGLLSFAELLRNALADLPRSVGRDALSVVLGAAGRNLLGLVLSGSLLLGGVRSVEGAAISILIASVALSAASLLYARSVVVGVSSPVAELTKTRAGGYVRKLLKLGSPLAIANIGMLAVNQLDILVVAAFFPSETVAVYALATRIVNLVGAILPAANATMISRISQPPFEVGSSDEHRLRTAATVVALPMLACAIGLQFFGPGAITRAFGGDYSAIGEVLRPLLIGQMVNLLTGMTGTAILRSERMHVLLATTLGFGVAGIVAEVGAGAHGSVELLALASGLALAGTNIAQYLYNRLVLSVDPAPFVWSLARRLLPFGQGSRGAALSDGSGDSLRTRPRR